MYLLIIICIVLLFVIYIHDNKVQKSINYYKKKKDNDYKIIAFIKLNDKLCERTIKSLLLQDIKIYDFYIETDNRNIFTNDIMKNLFKDKVHKFNSIKYIYTSRDFIIIPIRNGNIYPRNFITKKLEQFKKINQY
jgi:hypothetical protein